ncbi:MAG: hypothetical protein N2663_06535 [Chlorobi bacterium]|nr:hypothetical protein [Chlorobiota bacterium]
MPKVGKPSRTLPDSTVETIRQICRRHDAELLDYTLRGRSDSQILEIYIDNRDGVTHDLCRRISGDIELLFDRDPPFKSIARLDVSSPGVDRPLQQWWQYPKHTGRLLTVHLIDGTIVGGRLLLADAQHITIKTEHDILTIPFVQISSAIVQLEW